MEHRLILGGAEYLPFARSRIKALRAAGLQYARQNFEIGGVTINVRIAGEHSYLRLEESSGYSVIAIKPMVASWYEGEFNDPSYLVASNQPMEAIVRVDLPGNDKVIPSQFAATHLLIKVKKNAVISAGAIGRKDVVITRALIGYGKIFDGNPRKDVPVMSYGDGGGELSSNYTENSFWFGGRPIVLKMAGSDPDAPPEPFQMPAGNPRCMFTTRFAVGHDWTTGKLRGSIVLLYEESTEVVLHACKIYTDKELGVVMGPWERLAAAPKVPASTEGMYVTSVTSDEITTHTFKRRVWTTEEGKTEVIFSEALNDEAIGGVIFSGSVSLTEAAAPQVPADNFSEPTYSATLTTVNGGRVVIGTHPYLDGVGNPIIVNHNNEFGGSQDEATPYYVSKRTLDFESVTDGLTCRAQHEVTLTGVRYQTLVFSPSSTSAEMMAAMYALKQPGETVLAIHSWPSSWMRVMSGDNYVGVETLEISMTLVTCTIKYRWTQSLAQASVDPNRRWSATNSLTSDEYDARVALGQDGFYPIWTPVLSSYSRAQDSNFDYGFGDPHTGFMRLKYTLSGGVSGTVRQPLTDPGVMDVATSGLTGVMEITPPTGAPALLASAKTLGGTGTRSVYILKEYPVTQLGAMYAPTPVFTEASQTALAPNGTWAGTMGVPFNMFGGFLVGAMGGVPGPGASPLNSDPVLVADARTGVYIAKADLRTGRSGGDRRLDRVYKLVVGNKKGHYPLVSLINEWLTTVVPPEGSEVPPLSESFYKDDELFVESYGQFVAFPV